MPPGYFDPRAGPPAQETRNDRPSSTHHITFSYTGPVSNYPPGHPSTQRLRSQSTSSNAPRDAPRYPRRFSSLPSHLRRPYPTWDVEILDLHRQRRWRELALEHEERVDCCAACEHQAQGFTLYINLGPSGEPNAEVEPEQIASTTDAAPSLQPASELTPASSSVVTSTSTSTPMHGSGPASTFTPPSMFPSTSDSNPTHTDGENTISQTAPSPTQADVSMEDETTSVDMKPTKGRSPTTESSGTNITATTTSRTKSLKRKRSETGHARREPPPRSSPEHGVEVQPAKSACGA